MKTVISFPYIALFLFLLLWASFSRPVSDSFRSFSVASVAPTWQAVVAVSNRFGVRALSSNDKIELERLRVENQSLKNQMKWAREWILSEKKMNILMDQKAMIPSQVIYRDPSSWGSTLWINVGEVDNTLLGQGVISKNSPVISGLALVGVIDYVGKRQSRVRLITDPSVSPSVRAVRGAAQNREIVLLVESLLERLSVRKNLLSFEDQESLVKALSSLKMGLSEEREEHYLVKGELHGSAAPFWRSRGLMLQGTGFNYDYADAQGPARDLRSGRPIHHPGPPITLLKEGDLLVTSGLDGLFPPGLSVGVVASMSPLKPGAYAYELQAYPSANDLNDLDVLFVLPPLSGEE
jgi:cell shape-determining protein MreC